MLVICWWFLPWRPGSDPGLEEGRIMERVARVRVAGPLAPYAEGFRGELQRLGYTPLSAVVHMRLVARLSRWLAADGLEASALTTARTEAFFAERRAAGYGRRSPRRHLGL
jgi:hypothetical protein